MPFAPFPSPKAVTSFLGVRNTSPARSIPDNALSAAADVDLDNAGVITRRRGYTRSATIAAITASYSTLDKTPYIVANGALKRVDPSLGLVSIADSSATAFDDFGKVLFTNDGLKVQNDTVLPLTTEGRGAAPSLAAAPGTWPAGTYTAVYCYRSTATGLEGPSSEPASLTLGDNQSVTVIPPPVVAGHNAVVYLTDANGVVFYDATGVQLNPLQLGADPFPVGAEVLAYHENSIYLSFAQSNGSTRLVWSYPAYHHLFNFAKNYCVVPGEIRSMKSTSSGLLIGTDSSIFLYSDGALGSIAPYGVPAGQAMVRASDGKVKIFTNQGVCEAPPFANLTESKALFATGKQVSTAFIERDGIQQFVVLTDGSGTPYNTRT